jgi:CheY-like chemotaxis protein
MGSTPAAAPQNVLLMDDDQDFLEVYWEILQRLPSQPHIHTAATGARALALLESEPFDLMVADLQMPKMDGLQVLSVARRRYPQMRIVVLTGLCDEEFRVRAYGMGVDQFWIKPESEKEVRLFLESIESLLQHSREGGFRGLQSKSLVDIIQLESLSQSSGVLKVTNGVLEGRIWMHHGAVIDAEAQELTGEEAFRHILTWKGGNFEMLPPDPMRSRRIQISCQALLLETAQAMDEARHAKAQAPAADKSAAPVSPLTEFKQLPDVEFVLAAAASPLRKVEAWGVESPEQLADWTRESVRSFEMLGERLMAGPLQQVSGLGSPSHVVMANSSRGLLTVGFRAALRAEELRDQMKHLVARWVS